MSKKWEKVKGVSDQADPVATVGAHQLGGSGEFFEEVILPGDPLSDRPGNHGGQNDQASLEGVLQLVSSRIITGIVVP